MRMPFAPVDAILVAIYLLFLVVIGFVRRKGRSDPEDFLLAGRRITLIPFVASLAASWYGGILGVGEYSFRYGLSNWIVFGVPYYGAAVLFALLLARRAHRSRLVSIPDTLDKAYGKTAAVAGASLLLLITAPAAYVLMLGVLARLAFGWPLWLGVVAGTVFSTVYLFRGGLRADVVTDVVQFALMFLGFMLLDGLLLAKHGSLGFWQAHVPPAHLTWNGGRSAGAVLVWYFLALATLAEPSFFQRCFAARNEATARKGILLAVPFWFFFDALTTSAGLYARALMPDLADPVASYPALGARVLPAGARGIFFLGLLATIMSTVDTYAFLAAQTAGRDLFWRLRGEKGEERVNLYTRIGLALTAVISIVVALFFGSVIGIWHDLGSVGTPALVIPVMTSLSEKHRMRRGWALACMALGGGLSLAWLLTGYVPALHGTEGYLFGIEPIYPGLAASLVCFLAGRRNKGERHVAREIAPSKV